MIPNLWQDNFLTAAIPFVFAPYITALPGVAVPFQDTFVPENLPTAIHGTRPAGVCNGQKPGRSNEYSD